MSLHLTSQLALYIFVNHTRGDGAISNCANSKAVTVLLLAVLSNAAQIPRCCHFFRVMLMPVR